jgi:hypothetical protein
MVSDEELLQKHTFGSVYKMSDKEIYLMLMRQARQEERKRCLKILKSKFKEIKKGVEKEGYDTLWIGIGMSLFDMLDITIDEIKESD